MGEIYSFTLQLLACIHMYIMLTLSRMTNFSFFCIPIPPTLSSVIQSVPPDTKLSKLDILVLATAYIYHLTRTLNEQAGNNDKVNTSRHSLTASTPAHFKTLNTAFEEKDKSDSSMFPIGLPSRQKDTIFKIQAQHIGLHSTSSGADNQNQPRNSRNTLLHVKSDSVNTSTDQFLCQFLGVRQSAADQNSEKKNSQQSYCEPSGERSNTLTGHYGAVGIMHPVKVQLKLLPLFFTLGGLNTPILSSKIFNSF